MSTFNKSQLDFFCASSGAFSEVTHREATGDKSVTIDREEKSVLDQKIALDRFTRAGGVISDGKPSVQAFNIYDVNNHSYMLHDLAIKYPKAKGNELRLYFRRESGFYPEAGDVWFIFTRKGEGQPFIGFTSNEYWEYHISGDSRQKQYVHDYSLDEDDDQYQKDVASPQLRRDSSRETVNRYNRSASLGQRACKDAGYRCQYNPDHETFISASTGECFVEPHHFIPVSRKREFEYELDVKENIVVLCPTCHRAIHYGELSLRKKMLDTFYGQRIHGLRKKNIEVDQQKLYEFYGIDIDT